jgi:hypothetical protein
MKTWDAHSKFPSSDLGEVPKAEGVKNAKVFKKLFFALLACFAVHSPEKRYP